MHKLTLILSILFIGFLYAEADRKIEANPINVAVRLTERTDSASLASTCEFYGYTRQQPQDGYTVYRHSKGSTIRFTFKEADNGKDYPTVEVRSNVSRKERERILQELRFRKTGSAYERRSIGYTASCTSGPHGFLVFTCRPNPKR